MRTVLVMLLASLSSMAFAALWWFVSPGTFKGVGLMISIVAGFLAGMALIHFVLVDCAWWHAGASRSVRQEE